jgi:flavin reductase (DIM6/NTAB) family NADH-FMN oxidoreductase RutF
MGGFATGVTVITASHQAIVRAMTANAFMSGSLDPLLCVVSVAHRATMHDHLTRAGAFGISILSTAQQPIAAHFGGRPDPDLNVEFTSIGGVPTLTGAIATITAETVAAYPCGDHTLFVGRVSFMREGEGAPLLFHRGRYAMLVPELLNLPTPDL